MDLTCFLTCYFVPLILAIILLWPYYKNYISVIYKLIKLAFFPQCLVVAIDCERICCKSRKPGKKEQPVAAHCAVVNYCGRKLFNEYICPRHIDEVENWMGYHDREELIREGMPFDEARGKVLAHLKGKIIVVHQEFHDVDMLDMLDIRHEMKIRDTAICPFLRKYLPGEEGSKPFMKLKVLVEKVLKRKHQDKSPHDPLTDARAAIGLYREVKWKWEFSLLHKY